MPLQVLHLVGSAVSDWLAELSGLYAQACIAATADPTLYRFDIAYVTPDGTWRFPAGLSREELDSAPAVPAEQAVARIVAARPDVVVPQMFCLPGMTVYRGLFDVLAIPYVGNAADVMAVGADKARTRAVVAAAGVRVPDGEVCHPGERPTLRPPVVVKPVDADNSHGLSLVRDYADYPTALDRAHRYATAALVEAYVPLGREVRCGIVERGGELVCLPLEEYAVDEMQKPVRDEDDKIRRDDAGELGLVAKDADHAWLVDPDDPITASVWEQARRAHRALRCRGYSLFDFRVDPAGRPWFLEAGLYCSFAPQSVIVTMADAAGITVPTLFAEQLAATLSRAESHG